MPKMRTVKEIITLLKTADPNEQSVYISRCPDNSHIYMFVRNPPIIEAVFTINGECRFVQWSKGLYQITLIWSSFKK